MIYKNFTHFIKKTEKKTKVGFSPAVINLRGNPICVEGKQNEHK